MSQFARPDSDITVNSWVTTPLYQQIDEVSYSDSDHAMSPSNPSNSTCEIGLGNVSDPENNINHVLNFRIGGQGLASANGSVTVALFDGATEIASYLYTTIGSGVGGTVTAKQETLSTVEADNISDYSDLRIKVTANKTAGALWRGGITWFELSVDDVSAPSGWTHKIGGVANANISKVDSVAIANISKILGT